MNVIPLTTLDLGIAALLVVLLAGLSFRYRLQLGGKLLVAGLRTAVQLTLVGLILHWLFDRAGAGWILVMALVMLAIATREIIQRQRRTFRGWWGYGLAGGAMMCSSFIITILALSVIIRTEPWYQPRYSIPLLGMLLGNTMNGISLGLDRLLQTAWQQRAVIEQRLMLGHSGSRAITDIRLDSLRSALMPIINAMSVAGVVSLPGMMTGQILSGTAPVEAVKYQIMILFLITAGTGFGSVVAVWLGSRRLFDHRQRLRLDRLRAGRP